MRHCFKTSWVAMSRALPPTQTCLATNNWIVAGWERFLQKEERSSTFCNKMFYRPKANLFCSKWRKSGEWRDFRITLSNQKAVFTQLATTWFAAKQVWTRHGWWNAQHTFLNRFVAMLPNKFYQIHLFLWAGFFLAKNYPVYPQSSQCKNFECNYWLITLLPFF